MSGLDIVIAVVVLIGLWRGFQVGLIKTAVGLVGWFIALIAATRLAGSVARAAGAGCGSCAAQATPESEPSEVAPRPSAGDSSI